MASLTRITRIKRRQKRRKQGRKRKNKQSRRSTPPAGELFGDSAARPPRPRSE
jgi:hypothetical protein